LRVVILWSAKPEINVSGVRNQRPLLETHRMRTNPDTEKTGGLICLQNKYIPGISCGHLQHWVGSVPNPKTQRPIATREEIVENLRGGEGSFGFDQCEFSLLQ